MKLEVEVPFALTPAGLDRRLAGGWFRSGPILFRARILHSDEEVRELVHLRVRLDVGLSRSRRKLLRRNRARFRRVVGPARVDAARQRLYEATRARFLGFVASELDVVALGEHAEAFDTREVAVYDGDELVAVGYFDVGKRAVASILGLHDPRYARHSLGIYTMLEEMECARDHGARWYYPGYVIPGLPGFDYKLTLGPVEFLSPAGRWRTLAEAPTATPLADRAMGRMDELEGELVRRGLPHARWIYPAFWLGHMRHTGARFLRGPWHQRLGPPLGGTELVIEHLPEEDLYVTALVRPKLELDAFELFEPNPRLEALCERRALTYTRIVHSSGSAAAAVEAARALPGRLR